MQDGLDQLLKQMEKRLERTLAKLSLIQEGIEENFDDDGLHRPGTVAMRLLIGSCQRSGEDKKAPQFHRPAARQYRHSTPDGRTSFHFAFTRVNNIPTSTSATRGTKPAKAQKRKAPPHAHGRYIEREDAVALTELSAGQDHSAANIGVTIGTPDQSYPQEENTDDQYPIWSHAEFSTGLFGRSLLQWNAEDHRAKDEALGDGRTIALPDLSDLRLDRDKRGFEGKVPGAWGYDPALWGPGIELRYKRTFSSPVATSILNDPSESAREDRYIDRAAAVAIQPDGSRALITNIDRDADKREEFWRLVEQHERTAKADQITVCFADAPMFWQSVIADRSCPASLRTYYHVGDHNQPITFEIENAKAIRAFLEKQPGWIKNEKKPKGMSKEEWVTRPLPQAKFHDGRNGRTQYRIVGELPRELDASQCTKLLRELCREFERRKLPFVAVVHAPDAHNDDANWHFHLIFYDRPCRRITDNDLNKLSGEGYDATGYKAGDWDFAVRVPVPGRKERWKYPLRRQKDRAVVDDDYIKTLRRMLANTTNAALSDLGFDRRVDPETYEDMAIEVEPAEHLGTSGAAREARGIATPGGVRNEKKQDDFFRREIAERRATARSAAAARLRECRIERIGRVDNRALLEISGNLREAIELDHIADLIDHEMRRARSRPENVQRINRKLLDAARVAKDLLTKPDQKRRQRLVHDADDYLDWLDTAFAGEKTDVQKAREQAQSLRLAAEAAIRGMAMPAKPDPQHFETLPKTGESIDAVTREASGQDLQSPLPQIDVPVPTMRKPAKEPKASPQPHIPLNLDPAIPQPDIVARPAVWIETVEAERPLIEFSIGDRGVRYHVVDDWSEQDRPSAVQDRLQTLFIRQAEEIERLTSHVARNPHSVVPLATDDPAAPQYDIAGLSPDLSAAFGRYWKSPKIVEAFRKHEQIAAREEPERSIDIEPEPLGRESKNDDAPRSTQEPEQAIDHVQEPKAQPVQPMADEVVEASTAPIPAKPNSFDIQEFCRRAAAQAFELTTDKDDAVAIHCLQRAGVPDTWLMEVQAEPVIRVEAERQIMETRWAIEDHLKASPEDFSIGERFSLKATAPLRLRQLWAFHEQSKSFRDQLEPLIAIAYRKAEVARMDAEEGRQAAMGESAEFNAPTSASSPDRSDSDIATGNAAKAAAMRTALQRGR